MTGNFSLLQIAYEQCSLYRDNLRTSSGLWNHITFGSSPDKKAWATGNGWAAAGMLRVAATMMHSTFASTFTSQIADLGEWTQEIVNASFALQQVRRSSASPALLKLTHSTYSFFSLYSPTAYSRIISTFPTPSPTRPPLHFSPQCPTVSPSSTSPPPPFQPPKSPDKPSTLPYRPKAFCPPL